MFLKRLECSACGLEHDWSRLQDLCRSCNKPLFAIVDLAAANRILTREALPRRGKSLWRYREVLPLPLDVEPISLGEGGTPLLRARKFADDVDLWIKDESLNPTQSFKARGMSVAVSMAKYLGATKLAVPSAGNAGGALAAYAARAGVEAHVLMPRDTPRANIIECRGGTGLIGMWKAFDEMEALGWIGQDRPRMFAVQAAGCAPIVRAFEAGEKMAAGFPDAHTIASGLRVPTAISDFLMLKILRKSSGGAIAVNDEEMIRVAREVGASEGLFICPEGAACFAALKLLRSAGTIASGERVVAFNTGSGIKYLEAFDGQ
jgi:threonine synthase